MAQVRPLRGIRYNFEHVKLGGVLAPPYDVVSDAERDALYGRDLRNIVRIDNARDEVGDLPGESDRYTRAAGHLQAWLNLGILVQGSEPSFYVTDHEFTLADGTKHLRRGLLCRLRALPWDQAEVRPHERTLRGPKEDRLRLMEVTRTQTSPVFALWDHAIGIDAVLEQVCSQPAMAGGRTDGVSPGSDKHILWRCDDPALVAAIQRSLAESTLYIADGHHRYETAATYAERHRAEDGPDADSQYSLMYLCAADSPALELMPTHRLVLPRDSLPRSLPKLMERIGEPWMLVDGEGFDQAVRAAAIRRSSHHAFAVVVGKEAGLIVRPRGAASSPRAGLDVVVLEEEILVPLGINADAIREGALAYTRDSAEVERAVHDGEAGLGFVLNSVTPAEVMSVADAGETMPQKSTYFYPKVPTGLVLSPLG